jgi:hypothetical protein
MLNKRARMLEMVIKCDVNVRNGYKRQSKLFSNYIQLINKWTKLIVKYQIMTYAALAMSLTSENRPFELSGMPEVFASRAEIAPAVYKALKRGKLRKIGSRLYTKNLTEEPSRIVRRNWYALVREYFPDALIADRTALENRPALDGSVFLISAGTRDVVLPGITFRPRRGPSALASDLLFLGQVHLCSVARAWLENMRPSRIRSGKATRTLSRQELESRLDALLRQGGEAALNRLRDDAKAVSSELGMQDEYVRLHELVGAFLGTSDVELATPVGQARKLGRPYDPERVELFDRLYQELQSRAPTHRFIVPSTDAGRANLAFFEAYFSNYIEGTEFLVDEALSIVFEGNIPAERPADAHDILGTYRVVSADEPMARVPHTLEEFDSILRERHSLIMGMRPDKKPGHFKAKDNRAGNTVFVSADLVMGTLARGFDIYRRIELPFHRSVFMMFLISEIHPFVDGNGRVARIMMNGELVSAKESRIVIPTVYRNNYLVALKALSQNANPQPLIQALDFAQKYTSLIPWDDLASARAQLQATHALEDSNEAEDRGIRLVLPRSA